MFKMALISALAVVYTTPWDNYIVYNGAWTYPPGRVSAVVGYVPVEEYAFFVVQTVMTSLWTLLCVRWSTPCLNFNFDRHSYQAIRWIPIGLMATVAVTGYRMAVPGQDTFYMGCILCWVMPVIAFLWYGTGNFFVKKLVPSCVAIAVPTVYLCWVDRMAIGEGVWHINEATSLKVFVAEHLPIEEAFFFLIVNTIIVLAVNSYDKAHGMMDTYTSQFPDRFGINWKFIRFMVLAFITSEYTMPAVVVEDVKKCMHTIRVASKSFNTAGFLFQAGIRLDLIILYGFCRVTDDMIDEEPDVKMKKQKLKTIEKFLNDLFADRKSDYEVKAEPHRMHINWAQYTTELTDMELSCFRAISRIAFYLPRKPFYELLAGYQWDVEGRLVRTEDDLLLYSNYVAGSVGALCVCVMMYRCDNGNNELVGNYSHVTEKAEQIGRVLQLVNIARDIVTDSETLGRCYVPTEYMENEDKEIRILCTKKTPRSLGSDTLKKYSMRIIQLANKHKLESVDAIGWLPHETRGSVLAVIDIYHGLTNTIQSSPTYPTRASLSKWNKIWIAFYSLYIKSIQYVV